jgi:hypothetical protein
MNCKNLVDITIKSTTLTNVIIINCPNVKDLSTLTQLPSLSTLALGNCSEIDLSFLPQLLYLEDLSLVSDDKNLTLPPNLKLFNGQPVKIAKSSPPTLSNE